ncbi:MAG: IS1634 family transposase, partial [Dermatophilaceae bacterium]
MTSIIGKKRGNQTYYYLVTSARVEGKSRIVEQQYLGTSQEVLARLSGDQAETPQRLQHKGFGDLAAVWTTLTQLGVAATIDDAVGARRSHAGASVGTYLALAIANRVVAPCSKLAFADWWATTAGPRFTKIAPAVCGHRNFWDAMDTLDEGTLAGVEQAIAARMIAEFGLDQSALALDMTNFATFIDSTNERAPIAQRSHAKQKRTDLRLVGLGLVVTRDGDIPVLSHAYTGALPDITQFTTVIDELVTRYGALADPAGLSVVFDAGQNSEANFSHLDTAALHWVGSLPPSDHPDLLAIPTRRYRPIDTDRFAGLSAYPTRAHALGADRRVILTHSATLHAAQSAGFDQTLGKAIRALDELAATLARGKTRQPPAAVQTAIEAITRPRWIRRVLTTTLTADLRLTWCIDPAARRSLEKSIFGKRILVTDHDDWTIPEIVAGYRCQSEIEFGFRQLKDPHVVSFSPIPPWTDSKIRVHVFCCVLALAAAHLMRREAARIGLHLSVRELLTLLGDIEETVLLYHDGAKGRPRTRRILTDIDPTQQRLYDLFNLDQ